MLDLLLTFCLLVVVPGYQIWRSLRSRSDRPGQRLRNYGRTVVLAGTLLAALAAIWIPAGRSAAALGLTMTPGGVVGLGLAVILLAIGIGYMALAKPTQHGVPPQVDALMPTTPAELAAFLAMSLVIGTGWEILFRGYLLWSLGPVVGIWPAVAVAAAAYGLAHGYRSPGQMAGSLVSALAFTSAYTLTHSLWWLMLIHTVLPLAAFGGLARQKAAQALA